MTGRSLSEPARTFLCAHGVDPDSLRALAGDASTRRYGRAWRGDGLSVILVEGGDIEGWLRWRDFYDELGLRVPEALAHDDDGRLLIEDLGDEMLQDRCERDGALACRPQYERAAAWGVRLAEAGTARFRPDAADSDDPLTPRRLAWEMDFLLQHALQVPEETLSPSPEEDDGRLGATRRLLHRLCVDVHAAASAGPVLCHRDYHARNLMIAPDGDLAVIDFQDTRRGPRAYDLASLAHDPYVDLPEDIVAGLVRAWQPDDATDASWDREVALAAGQRLLKAAGSYAWLGHGCGRTRYLQWFAPAVERAFDRLRAHWAETDRLAGEFATLGLLGRS